MQIELYKELYANLISSASIAGIDEPALQKYFSPEEDTTSESILFRLCSSLQNSGMMRNSIKFNDKDTTYKKAIKKVLFDFDTKKSADTYPDWRCIYNAMLAAGVIDNGIKEKKETNWEKYCRGLYDGLRFLTARSNAMNMYKRIQKLNKAIHGWVNYYRIADMRSPLREMDKGLRRRLRMCYWKQWKRTSAKHRNLIKLGIPEGKAWEFANSPILHRTLTKDYFKDLGLHSLTMVYEKVRQFY